MSIIGDYYSKKESYAPGKERMRKILELAGGNLKGKRILDLACGNGMLGKAFKDRGAYVIGCDISSSSVAIAQKFLDEVFVFDLENDDFSRFINKFDIIIASEIIEHLFLPEKFLLNLKNISNKNTKIILTTPNFLVWTNRIKMLLGRFEYSSIGLLDESHIHFFTYNSLSKLLSKVGFVIEEENHLIHPKIPQWLGILSPNLFAFQIIVKLK